jgi:hypothetical protein
MYKQAAQKTTAVLSLPQEWLGMYSEFITKNSSAVSQIESALRSLTYIIPGAHRIRKTMAIVSLISYRSLSGIRDSIRVA